MTSYFLAADLLGFSSIVSNLDQDELDKRINVWTNLVQKIKSEARINDLQLISDTLFVREEDSEDGLQRMIRFARSLLEESIRRALPIRGAITHGEVTWGILTYGKPVIEAHRLEGSQDWIGISCSSKLPRIDCFWGWNSVVVYPVPRKSGRIKLSPVVVWEIPGIDTLVSKTTTEGLYKKGDLLTWEWQSKLMQTVLFSQYIAWGNSTTLSPAHYYGTTPGHFLETHPGSRRTAG